MNKKITVIILLTSFVILSCNSGIAINIKNNNNELSEEYISDVKTYNTNIDFNDSYVFQAYGPVRKITYMNFIDGSPDIISKFNNFMTRRLFYPIIPYILVTNLTFTISFDEPVENRYEYRYWYATAFTKINISEQEMNMTINIPHSRIIYNFTGIIYFQRPKIIKLTAVGPKLFIPYRFCIIGYCEDIETNNDII